MTDQETEFPKFDVLEEQKNNFVINLSIHVTYGFSHCRILHSDVDLRLKKNSIEMLGKIGLMKMR